MKYIVRAVKRADFSGFNRSGRFWDNIGVEVDESEVTDDMKAEPMLIITPVIEIGDPTDPAQSSEPVDPTDPAVQVDPTTNPADPAQPTEQ